MSKETWVFLLPEALAFKITQLIASRGQVLWSEGKCRWRVHNAAKELKARIWREILSGKKKLFVPPDSAISTYLSDSLYLSTLEPWGQHLALPFL